MKNFVFIAIALALFPACSSAQSQLPRKWTAFRYNPELNAAVARRSGMNVRWTFRADGGISSSPTLSGDTLFVASNGGSLYALSVLTGKLLWKFKARNALMTAPLVTGRTVIVAEGNNYATNFDPNNYLLLGTGSNRILGIDAITGAKRWEFSVPASAMSTGAIVDGMYVHHDASGMLFAIDATTGKYRWREYLKSSATMGAANRFRGDDVVTAGDYPDDVIAFDGKTGRVLWRKHFPNDSAAFDDCPVASDGTDVYGMYLARPAGSRFHFVGYTTPGIEHAYALDGETGRLLWDSALVRGTVPINNAASIPLIYRGMLYVGSAMRRTVFAIDTRTGKIRWRLRANGKVKGGKVAVDGVVYFGDTSGTLWAVEAASGKVLGRKRMPDSFNVGSPIIVCRTLIIGSKKGYVYALPLDSFVTKHR